MKTLKIIIGILFIHIAGGLVGLVIDLNRLNDYDTIIYIASLMFIIFMIVWLFAFGLSMILKGCEKHQ